jgi:excisionase family DNA binding protein
MKNQRRKKSDLLDLQAAADYLTLSEDTVRKLIESGALHTRKVGRKWFAKKDDLYKWGLADIERERRQQKRTN